MLPKNKRRLGFNAGGSCNAVQEGRGRYGSQAEILTYLVKHIEEFGYQPTFGEIGEALGGITIPAVRDRVIQLAEKGFVQFTGKKRERALRIVGVTFRAVVGGEPPEVDAEHIPQTGASARNAIAEVLGSADGPMTVNELAAELGVSIGTVHKALAHDLERRFETVDGKWRLAPAT